MAYDGFVINRRLNDIRDIEALVETMCDILLGAGISEQRPPPAVRARRSAT